MMKKLSLYVFFASKNEWIYFDETKWMYFFIKDDELLKNIKSGIKSATVLKKDLTVNQCTTKNI